MTLEKRQRVGRFAVSGKLLLFALASILLLAGCASNRPKRVIRIRVRSNRVEAQSPHNQFQPDVFAPAPSSTPTPTPAPTPEGPAAQPTPMATVPLPPAPTPTPVPIPYGPPERIVIPSIDVDTSITTVESQASQIGSQWFENWKTAAFAAGFHGSSALLGQPGNTVISGHNNIDGAVFQNLYQTQPGDVVQLYANGFRYDYIVEDRFIVRERGVPLEQRVQNASWIRTTVDERVTLVSCWPPTGNDFRVIVVAKPLSRLAGSSDASVTRTN